MSNFSYVCWPNICLLLKSVCSYPSSTSGWVCFLLVNLFWFFVDSGYQPFVRWVACKNFFPFCWLLVHSKDSFFCCAEALEFNQIPLVGFSFCCQCLWCFSHEVLAYAYVLNGIAYVFLQGFYGARSYVLIFNPPGDNFCIRCKEGVQFQLSAHCQPVFPTPFIKQEILSSLLVFVRFVKDQMVVDVWH